MMKAHNKKAAHYPVLHNKIHRYTRMPKATIMNLLLWYIELTTKAKLSVFSDQVMVAIYVVKNLEEVMKVCANSVNNEFHTQAAVSPSICFVIK